MNSRNFYGNNNNNNSNNNNSNNEGQSLLNGAMAKRKEEMLQEDNHTDTGEDDGENVPLNSETVIDDLLDPCLLKPPNNIIYHEKTTCPLENAKNHKNSNGLLSNEEVNRSKQSLKGSRMSFDRKDQNNESSDEDSFESRRIGFQKQKYANFDHKGILKDLKNILAHDDRQQFQNKKHVSLDVNGTRRLQDFLKDTNSPKESAIEKEFQRNRRDFQGRKHQSLDSRVTLRLHRILQGDASDSEEDNELRHLIHRSKDINEPIVVDIKNLEVSEESEEDYISAREHFQQQISISVDSRKSRYYDMPEKDGKKDKDSSIPLVRQVKEDGKPKLEIYKPAINPIYIWSQVLAAFSVSMGSMVVGFSAGYTSPALVTMRDGNITSFEVSEQAASWVGGVMPLAGLLGGIIGGPLIEFLGRRNTILCTAPPFIFAWLLIGFAVHIAMILVGRALCGFCVGIASLALPVYLGETIQPEVRGTLGLMPTALGNIGILIGFVVGTYLNWSHLAFFGACLPLPFLILMFFIPETPRWYVLRNKEERARKSLIWLRGKKADVEPELQGLMSSYSDNNEKIGKRGLITDLLKRNNLKSLLVSLGLMFFQQFSGINVVIFYTVSIFKDAGSTIDGNICTIIVGVVNFMATFIATVFIDRLGRKVLLYISDVAMIVTLFILGSYFYCKNIGMDISSVGWLPLASFMIYVLGFSFGFGPIPWLMMGEILPARVRGIAAAVATAFNWACTFIVTKTYIDVIDLIGPHGAFWLYCAICIVGLIFVIFCVPETQGKSLEEIERIMMGRVKRMSVAGNVKPLPSSM